jgi:nucleoside-diphosphate-sugar epimerase
MRVLVTGAGGFLGHHTVWRLLQAGHSVRAIVRPASPPPEWDSGVETVRGDLRTFDDASVFSNIDVVLHLAAATSGNEDVQFASTVGATERFLELMARGATRRLVLVSSLAVYDWSQAHHTLDETTPVLKDVYGMGAYTIAKAWQERVAQKFAKEHAWDLTIMRPGFIWGRDHAEIAGMGRHAGRVYLMFGPFTRLPLTHVENCADCLVAAVENPSLRGEVFNIVDSDEIRVWRYVKEYASRTGQKGVLLAIPYRLGLWLAQIAAWTSRMFYGSKGKLPSLLTPGRFEAQFKPVRFSSEQLKTRMKWKPPLSFDACLARTYGPAV